MLEHGEVTAGKEQMQLVVAHGSVGDLRSRSAIGWLPRASITDLDHSIVAINQLGRTAVQRR